MQSTKLRSRPIFFTIVLPSLLSLASATAWTQIKAPSQDARVAEIQQIRSELHLLEERLARLEAEPKSSTPEAQPSDATVTPSVAAATPATAEVASVSSSHATAAGESANQKSAALTPEDHSTLNFFRGTTLNFGIDGYYAYNFNQPVGRVNLLRVYDVSSNSFSLNQASIVIEHLPQAESGKRIGGRLDLQFGQATETLQGSSANEQRPQVWRNLFQAYGSYLAPVGSGLQLDFGKFASSLGIEGNYTKDQINYSRSYFFNYLPYYHMGLRANYNVTSKVNVAYWLVNGAQQVEDFNGFKSQAFLFTLKPAKTLSWNVNYYFGQEQRDVLAMLNPGIPASPTQPGLPVANISPNPNGREHIFDSYATWTPTSKLTLIGEGDYVINRALSQTAPSHVSGGAAYVRYALPRNWAVAARAEYLSDRGGLFSGRTQALKETTFTLEHQFEGGLTSHFEYRRDFSNHRFFLTDTPGLLSNSQSTATVGLVYWWGQKQGAW